MAFTISSALAHARALLTSEGIESAYVDAELLLAHCLRIRRIDLIIHRDRLLSDTEFGAYHALLGRRIRREPVAYIIGAKEFFGRTFRVNPHVLIPRPDTEILVEEAIAFAPRGATVFEIGVGSGAVICSVLCEREDLMGFGNDISIHAIRTAMANAGALGVSDRLMLFAGNCLDGLGVKWPVILANPPYIPLGDERGLDDDVRLYEPHDALFSGKDGLDIVERIIRDLPRYLVTGGVLIMEAGFGQQDAIDSLADEAASLRVKTWVNDLSGIPRAVIIERVHG